MMKRNILALVIPALLAAGAANAAEVYNKDGNKLDLYGKAVGLHYFTHGDGYAADGDQSYVRMGFKGETQINDMLTGYGQWEYQFNTNNSEGDDDAQEGNKTRLGFAGLKFGDYGSFDYGRNYAVAYDVLGWTDMMPEFGGDYAQADSMGGRTGGVATYRNTTSSVWLMAGISQLNIRARTTVTIYSVLTVTATASLLLIPHQSA